MEEDADPDENESESRDEADANEVNDESAVESEKGETEGDGEVEQGDTEWPEIEQSKPDELFDGLEVDDDQSQGEG